MKRWGLSLFLLVGVLAGCQSAARPSTGLANLRVRVTAEPKEGVPTSSGQLQVYDAAARNQPGAFEHIDYGSLDDIVVWAEPVAPSDTTVVLPPRVVNVTGPMESDSPIVAASVRQELVLFNRSSRSMNIYSVSDANDFDLGSIAPGQRGSYVIKSTGLIDILSDRAARPLAVVYAVPTPFVAETRSGAEVSFDHLPPGDYRVCSWHPRLPGSVVSVHLSADQTKSSTITVGVNSLPKVYSH